MILTIVKKILQREAILMAVVTYRDLIVWQRSIEMVVAVYELTEHFPNTEKYGLSTQMRRAAVSIPSNIAEGRSRKGKNQYLYFLRIAFGSGAELETQIEIAKRLKQTQHVSFTEAEKLLGEVMKMLNVILRKLGSEASC